MWFAASIPPVTYIWHFSLCYASPSSPPLHSLPYSPQQTLVCDAYLLLAFEFFDLAPLALSIWMIGCNFRSILASYVCIYCYNFPLDSALNVSQRFWYVVSSFSFVSKNIFISALFHCLSSQRSRASCSISMKLCISELVSEF